MEELNETSEKNKELNSAIDAANATILELKVFQKEHVCHPIFVILQQMLTTILTDFCFPACLSTLPSLHI